MWGYGFETREDAIKRFIELRYEYRIQYALLKKEKFNDPHSHLLNLYEELVKLGTRLEHSGINLDNVE